jgi:predicted nucleotidyltransferase
VRYVAERETHRTEARRADPPSADVPDLQRGDGSLIAGGILSRRDDAMKSTQDVLRILHEARPRLAQEFGVTRLALFGSYARGDQREDSDVDVLVEVAPSIGLRFVDLADRIEALVGIRSDVVSRRALAPRQWAHIEPELVDVR